MVELAPLQRLLLAYASASAREWQGLCWLLDQRLAAIAQRGGEPTIGAIRLAWWDAVLVERDAGKGGGEPLVEHWRRIAPHGAEPYAAQLIDGWRALIAPEAMSDEDLAGYAQARGGGLFALLAAGAPADQAEAIQAAGQAWALWDLAAHTRDEALARRALLLAREPLAAPGPGGRALKPLRLARAAIRPDITAGRVPAGGFSARHYGRLLLAALRG
jgi:phytoene synthase